MCGCVGGWVGRLGGCGWECVRGCVLWWCWVGGDGEIGGWRLGKYGVRGMGRGKLGDGMDRLMWGLN